jgi:UDP-2-acetamido-2-deoxy-ribo-hexuluronate aminotransferase
MQFIDLAAQQKKIVNDVTDRIKKVLGHGLYIQGPEVRELEKELAAYVGVDHAVGCSSGTDALLLALMAMGIGPGDAVFTTPFTFVATAEVISLVGATPVFVDIDPVTCNMSPEALDRAVNAVLAGEPKMHPLPAPCGPPKGDKIKWLSGSCPVRPRAVIAVDLFGLCADYDAINGIAEKHGLAVIEDAAQSFGAEYKGKKACSLAAAGCTSFFPAKPLGCYGDGGMCFTDDLALAELMRSIRVHGQGSDRYDNVRIGINGRLDSLQAAILLSKFLVFPDEVTKRQEVAKRYSEGLAGSGLYALPSVPEGYLSVFAQYTLAVKDAGQRDGVLNHLKEKGVPTAVYYPKPLHRQEAFAYLGYVKGDFPVSDDLCDRVFSVPMHPYLERDDQNRIIDALLSFCPCR